MSRPTALAGPYKTYYRLASRIFTYTDHYRLASRTLANSTKTIQFLSVADYGDKDNSDLGERFGVKKDDFPEYRLFVKGRDLDDPIKFTGNKESEDSLKKFIVKESGKNKGFFFFFFFFWCLRLFCLSETFLLLSLLAKHTLPRNR